MIKEDLYKRYRVFTFSTFLHAFFLSSRLALHVITTPSAIRAIRCVMWPTATVTPGRRSMGPFAIKREVRVVGMILVVVIWVILLGETPGLWDVDRPRHHGR